MWIILVGKWKKRNNIGILDVSIFRLKFTIVHNSTVNNSNRKQTENISSQKEITWK
jgi:hypothetical protein